MTGRQAAIALLGMLCWLPLASAQEFVRIGNRLAPDQFLHIERGPLQSGRVEPQWWSAQWRLEFGKGQAAGTVRFRNRWKSTEFLRTATSGDAWQMDVLENGALMRLRSVKSGEYLHLERGVLQTGAVPPDAPSSHWRLAEAEPGKLTLAQGARTSRMVNRLSSPHDWTIEQVAGLEFFRVRNTTTPNVYYHIERGRLESGPVEPGWWSAQWKVDRAEGARFFRLRNRWRSDQFLHIAQGAPASGPVPTDMPGAEWMLAEVSAAPPSPPAGRRPVARPELSGARPASS